MNTVSIQHTDDFTNIPVKVFKDGVYQFEMEDGLKMFEREDLPEEDDFDYSDHHRELERDLEDC
jgi:hypothetical protein